MNTKIISITDIEYQKKQIKKLNVEYWFYYIVLETMILIISMCAGLGIDDRNLSVLVSAFSGSMLTLLNYGFIQYELKDRISEILRSPR